MPIIQRQDKNRNLYKNTLYVHSGSGFNTNKAYYYQGGFINLSSLINAGKSAIDVIQNNKELISSGANAIGKVVDLGKSISDTVKTSKELEKIKELRELNKNKPKKEYIMTPEQESKLKAIGSGFATFSAKK